MKHTEKYNEGYRWYVYVAPGQIEYFEKFHDADFFAKENSSITEELV